MEYLKLCDSDYRFMLIVWEHAPVEFRRTGKTVRRSAGMEKINHLYGNKKLCDKGYITNENAVVSVVIPRSGYRRRKRNILWSVPLEAPCPSCGRFPWGKRFRKKKRKALRH